MFHRHATNPILTAEDWPYPAHSVFNPAATRLSDGTTLLLCRVEDRRGHSHLCAARSQNGVDGWTIDEEPTMRPEPERYPEELWGIEDPRITFVEELGKYAIAYTAFSKGGPGVALALTDDFRRFERLGLVMQPDDKDAALCPVASTAASRSFIVRWPTRERTCGSPTRRICATGAATSFILPARKGSWWDANKVGMSPPPIETARGWLMIYHGVRNTASGSLYRLGLALFALDRPEQCLLRGDSWIFGPEAPYEREGDVPNVAFPCGYTLGADGDTINLYYGGADSCVALATGSIRQLLGWLDEHGVAS